jgi:neutral ceramidase
VTTPDISAGFGSSKITPDRSLELAGITGNRKGEKALDDLRVRAISVSSGETTLVLVSVDTLYVSRKFCDGLGAWLQDTYGVPSDNLMVAATHTHCAPLLSDRYFDNVKVDQDFIETAEAATRSSIRQAMDQQAEAAIEFSSDTAQVSIHRRARRLDRIALRRFRPRMTMANRPNRRGPVDNTVRVIRFRMKTADQTDIVLISMGCHPSIIRENVYSADYPGLIEHHFNDNSDRPARVLFVQGFSGDTRPRLLDTAPLAGWPPGRVFDFLFDRQRFRKDSAPADAEWVAISVAKAAARAPAISIESPNLSARRIEVPLPLSELPDLKDLERLAMAEEEPEWRHRYARFAIAAYADAAVVPIRVHRWSLGHGLCRLGLEGEIFSEFSGWMDRLGADFGINPVPASCVGGMAGYIPTAHALDGGGYEVDRSRELFGLPARFSSESESALKDGIRELFLDSDR